MPDPKDYGDRDAFMKVCVPQAIKEGKGQDQAVAMCSTMWDDSTGASTKNSAGGRPLKAKRKPTELVLPALQMDARFEPKTADKKNRTVEVRWYTGSQVERYSLLDGPFMLSFKMDPKAIRLGTLNGGYAPLKGGHSENDDISKIFGVIEKAWMEKDGGHAQVRFSGRPDVEPYFQDVLSGIIRNVSMEARVHSLTDVTENGSQMPAYLATDWEPLAIALVAVGADPFAQALSEQQPEVFRCSLVHRSARGAMKKGTDMEIKVRLLAEVPALGRLGKQGKVVAIDAEDYDEKIHWKNVEDEEGFDERLAELTEEKIAADAATTEANRRSVEFAIETDKARGKEIKRLAAHYNLDDLWVQRHIRNGSSIEQVILDATNKRAENQPLVADDRITMGDDMDSLAWRTDRMSEALAARAMGQACPEIADQYKISTLAQVAFECLRLRNQTSGRNLDPWRHGGQVIRLALHSTTDFPKILENVLNKTLMAQWELATPTYTQIAVEREFKDFRPHKFIRAGDFPVPLQVGENGEFTYGTMSESSEAVSAVTYGRILGISRQILINDDLSAFQDFGASVSRRISDFLNATFFTNVILPIANAGTGPTMSDGSVVYSAAHNNVLAGGTLAANGNTLLAEALAKMMTQQSLDGLKLNVEPAIILVPPASVVAARTLVAQIYPATAGSVNPFAGLLRVIGDANLTATGTRFYVLAEPGRLPNYIYGGISGQAAPYTEVRTGFEVDGIEVKVRIDFGCGVIDYRGGCTGAGT